MLSTRLYYIICMAVIGSLAVGGVIWNEEFKSVQYDSIEHPGYYILLNADHSVVVYQGEKESFTGTWENSNGKLLITSSYFTFVLTIKDKELIDQTGERWVHQ